MPVKIDGFDQEVKWGGEEKIFRALKEANELIAIFVSGVKQAQKVNLQLPNIRICYPRNIDRLNHYTIHEELPRIN